ncbi:MAG TPA: hypothetical protein PLX97_00465 [Gemmatales bacterium]|nr:hypothetical protein [Gemmatales bacterium]
MLSLTDCLDFIDLDRDTIEVIARHERIPTIVATELGNQLIADLRGIHALHQMHRDLLAQAAERHDLEDEKRLRQTYAAFSRKYPMPTQLPTKPRGRTRK